MRNGLIRLAALSFTLAACGAQQDESSESPTTNSETPYGSVEEVTTYLETIGPFVRDISTVQHNLEERSVGTTGKSAAPNLAPAAADAEQELKKILLAFEDVSPPPLLAPFHRDTKKLILLRIGAYRASVEGFAVQEDGGEAQSHYTEAEAKFRQANQMIGELNTNMRLITDALGRASAERAG